MSENQPCVYIMTNIHNKVLYTGVTNNLERRVQEHKEYQLGRFTSKYRVNKLVYFETTERMVDAIAREKQIKAGSRQRKIELIESINPEWEDLFGELFRTVKPRLLRPLPLLTQRLLLAMTEKCALLANE